MAAILIKCPALGPRQFESHMLCHVTHSQGLLLRSQPTSTQVKNPANRKTISLDLGRNNENILLLIWWCLCLWILCARVGLYSFWRRKRVEKHGWQWLHETPDLLTKHCFRTKKVTLASTLRPGEEYFISNRRTFFSPASKAGSNVELSHVPGEHNLRLFSLACA